MTSVMSATTAKMWRCSPKKKTQHAGCVLYLKAYKDVFGDEGDPYEENCFDYQYTKDYSYIFGEYYFDIFEKEV